MQKINVNTFNIYGIKISRFKESDILAHVNFGVHSLCTMDPDNKENLMLLLLLLLLLFNTILWHLLESPRRGNSNEMPQGIV